MDSTINEPFILRCLANVCTRPPQHESLALDPFLFAICGTTTTLLAQSPYGDTRTDDCTTRTTNHTPIITDDVLKDVLIPVLYYKCDVEALNRVMTQLDNQYYERSEGMVQWGFMVFWTSVKGALQYRPEHDN